MLKGVFIDVKKLFCCDMRKFKCFFCFYCVVSCLLLGVLFVVIWVCNK